MNRTYELFLLMFNLSVLHDRERMIGLFTEGIHEIFTDLNLVYSNGGNHKGNDEYEIRTKNNCYGFITVTGAEKVEKAYISIITSAIQMLAIFIENLEYGEKLSGEKKSLENMAALKLEELKQTISDLEDSRRASVNIIEDLSLEIEKRKLAEKKILESEGKFRNLFENSPLAKSMTGIDGKVNVNRSFCDLLEYTSDELNSKNWKEITHPDDIEHSEKEILLLRSGVKDQLRLEKRYISKTGRIIWAEVSSFLQRDEHGTPVYYITTVNNITDRKNLENERFKLLDIIDVSLNEIYIFKSDTLKFEYVNKGALRNIGYTFEEMLDKTPYDIKPEISELRFRELIKPLITGEERMLKFETFHQRKDQSLYPVEVHLQFYEKEMESIFFAVINDITERRKADEAIRKLNEELEERVKLRTSQLEAANKELEAFSYSVSHDLRAPLRAIHSFTTILRDDYSDTLGEEGKRICNIIESSSERMGTLIDDLLAFSRLGRNSMNYSKIDMNALVGEVINELAGTYEKTKTELKVNNIPEARGDTQMIRLVITNLLSNAIKYSARSEKSEIEVGFEKNKNDNVYYVKDNGVGFDMKYSDKLFRVFQRLHTDREFEGNGVGLAIVKRIIKRHGGKVWAESEPGKGSVFYFTLPSDTGIDMEWIELNRNFYN